MSDPTDIATEREEIARADALRDQQRRAALAEKAARPSATECAVCDCPIPDARREAVPGVDTCVLCQSELEQATRMQGGRK